MTDVALTQMLEDSFGSAEGPFYLGFIDATGYTGIDRANDTMASHAGWQEFTGYSGNRPEWEPGAAAAKQITNPSRPSVTTTAAGAIVGYFLTTNSTKGGTTGLLKDHALLSTPLSFASGKNLLPQHTFTIRDRGAP